MSKNWVADHEWHDIRYQDLPDWVKRRGKELNHRELVGKTFRYRRDAKTGKYQRRLLPGRQHGSPSAASLHRKGLALNRQGRHEEALSCFSEAIRLNPKDNTAWHRKGIELNALGKYNEAIVCFDRALDINRTDHFAWNHKAVALRELGRYKEALSCCDEAIRLSEEYPLAWYNKGMILSRLGNRTEAQASYERAAELDPEKFPIPAAPSAPDIVDTPGESTPDWFTDKLAKWLDKRTMALATICTLVGFALAIFGWVNIRLGYDIDYNLLAPTILGCCIAVIGLVLIIVRLWFRLKAHKAYLEQQKGEIIAMIEEAFKTEGGNKQ